MPNEKSQNPVKDRRDVLKQGSSLNGSKVQESTDPEALEVVDQDPGERQKENQNQIKEDPLAA